MGRLVDKYRQTGKNVQADWLTNIGKWWKGMAVQ
jgi:hypothetical protein